MPTEISFPTGLRPADSNVRFEPIDIAKSFAMDRGEDRRRPIYRTVPQIGNVSWTFTQAQFDQFWTWFEETLVSGSLPFDVELERQGGPGIGANPRTQWWTAQFFEEPSYLTESGYRYTVSAALILRGQPFENRITPPVAGAGSDQDAGAWRPTGSPAAAAGSDEDGFGWLVVVAGASIASAGLDVDGGELATQGLAILAFGLDADEGGWLQYPAIIATSDDFDSGGWELSSFAIQAEGLDLDSGGWTPSNVVVAFDPRVTELLGLPNGFVVRVNGEFATRILSPGDNVSIFNPAGAGGNPIISSTGTGTGSEYIPITTEDGVRILTEDNLRLSREFRFNTSVPILTESGFTNRITTEDGNAILTE